MSTDTRLPETIPMQVPTAIDTEYLSPLTAREIKGQVQLIQEVMQAVMQEGHHYGIIPGTDKPTLLKPGAEKLTVTFRLAPILHVDMRDLGNGHREYQVRCTLVHIPTGRVCGEGIGLCSTMESRYRYRKAERTCPHCSNAAIIKGKAEYGGGYICFQRKGGCGAKFNDNDPAIINQPTGRVENADLADVHNTILKMAKKRALVDATLTTTAASDIFSQDIEDFVDDSVHEETKPKVLPTPTTESTLKIVPKPNVSAELSATKDTKSHQGPLATKGQLEIITLALRRGRINENSLQQYLTTLGISELQALPQGLVNTVLKWIQEESDKKEEVGEREFKKGIQEVIPGAKETSKKPTGDEAWYEGRFVSGSSSPDDKSHQFIIKTSTGAHTLVCTALPKELNQNREWDTFGDSPCRFRVNKKKTADGKTVNELVDIQLDEIQF